MRIAEYHTYFIGRDEWGFSIWTHNSCYKAYADSYGSFMIRRFNNGQIEQLLDSSGNAIRFETLEEAEAAAARLNAPKAGSVPRAKVVGVPESSDVVTLWKAPGKGRTGAASEVTNGFDPAKYPGDGPYLATDKSIAEGFQRSYGNGLQEINIPRSKFDELVHKGVIKVDGYYDAGRSWHVPADRLAEFNEAIGQGPANQFHP